MNEVSRKEIHSMPIQLAGEVEDPFLAFIDYARSVISLEEDEIEEEEDVMSKKKNPSEAMAEASGPGWGWIAWSVLKTCTAYSSGVTAAILLSDLSQYGYVRKVRSRSDETGDVYKFLRCRFLICLAFYRNAMFLTDVLATSVYDETAGLTVNDPVLRTHKLSKAQ
ncbi:hypothetical protein F2Q68_00001660 [Brassica cretica]|uniref:Cell division control protein 24 OB domain-containing protein n=1 Tax=Brassica cretica TaxID=69181 RepID=A0A8S9J9R8_BRACR|nr:hypothetical protein F2Q68_00001660 [Brassica cretica]